ncbi:MAG: tetratricopeptide repeat protein, partial [Nitrospinaceae bacterium]
RRQAYLLGNLGIVYLHKKDFDQSYDYYNRSLEIMTKMGDELGEARSYANLGKIEALKKNWDAAAEQYGKSLKIMEKLQNRPGMAQQNEALGEVFLKKEEFEKGEEFLQNANVMYEALKDPQSVRIVQNKLLYILSHPKTIEKRKGEIEAELKKPELEKDSVKKISLLTDLGNLFFLGSRLDDAQTTLEEVLKIQEESGDKSGMSSTYGNLGSILSEKEDWEASDRYYGKAIALREELSSDSTAPLELYSSRANVLIHLNKLDQAEKLMRQSLKINEKTGSGLGLVNDYRNLGNVSLQKQDWAGAEQFYKKSLDLNTKVSNRPQMAEDYRNLFNLYTQNENWNEAEKYCHKSLGIAEELQDLRNACQDIRNLARIYNEKKDRSKVEPYYKMALEKSQKLDDPREIVIDLRNLGTLYMEKGYTEKAEDHYKQALSISEELGDRKEMAEDFRNMGNFHFRRGYADRAQEYYQKALDYTLEVGDAFGSAKDYTFLGNLKFRGEDFNGAEDYFKKAADIFNNRKNFVNLIQLYMTVARMNLAESRKEPCESYLGLAEGVAQLLGNPEKLTHSIEEMRKMAERIDKI